MKFEDVYNKITKYYPIGLDNFDQNYQEFSGFQLLLKMIENKMMPEHFANKWKPFVKSIKNVFPELIRTSSETMLMDVCYSGQLVIKEEVTKSIHFKQTLVFHLSVIESFFTVYGRNDISILYSDKHKQDLIFDPVITVSPIGAYEKYYNYIKSSIQDSYPESNFIPYVLLKQRINGLSLDSHLKENQDPSVFQALFVGENLTDYKTQGDEL
jgi:hypothetical protein